LSTYYIGELVGLSAFRLVGIQATSHRNNTKKQLSGIGLGSGWTDSFSPGRTDNITNRNSVH